MPRGIRVQTNQNNNDFERISWGTNFLMTSFAFMVDATQVALDLIPYVGWIISSILAGFGYFLLWFIWKLNGVSFTDRLGGKFGRKLLLRFGGSAFLEATLSFIPSLTILVITTNSMLKSEDKLVQEGVITPEEIGKIKKIIAERNVQNAKELLELAREEAKQRARRKAQKTIRNQKRRLVGNSIRSRQEVNRQLQNQTNKYPRSEN